LIELDARLTGRMRIAERPGALRTLAMVLAHSGDSWFWLAGLILIWWLGSGSWERWALTLIIAILVTAGLVFAVKLVVRRQRPEGEWGKFYRRTDPHSFPSGHAVRAMMLAVVTLGLGPTWLGLLLLGWAFLVGLARVAMGLHYLSDVAAGMLMGLVIALVVLMVV
jgi:membrane-associated phospholipid phosphatase